ncbi:MAG TPA: serine/threonine-protein kinase [Gemmatimonadales bacterium]|nr:serine/threonine-protein kinase [Gemmatimonadales bacterium]
MMSRSDHKPLDAPAPGMLVQGRFRLSQRLAAGSGSMVYAALDLHQGIEVALKVLQLPDAERSRVRRDVLALWDITHDHIVPIQGCFEDAERFWVVADLIDGPDLAAAVARSPLSSDEVAAIGRGIALGLKAAHRRGILHRHIKPTNILIARNVRGRLADFGCAGFGLPATGTGPLDFAAPETLAGQPADARADLYGLGLSLFFALTGRLPPRQAADRPPAAAPDGHRPSRYVATVPDWLDDAIAMATAALPADRFNSAGRLAEALAPIPAGTRRAPVATS